MTPSQRLLKFTTPFYMERFSNAKELVGGFEKFAERLHKWNMGCLRQILSLSSANTDNVYRYLNDVCKSVLSRDLQFEGGAEEIYATLKSIEPALGDDHIFDFMGSAKYYMFPHIDVILLFILKIDVFLTYPTIMNAEDLSTDTYGLIHVDPPKSRARMGIQFSTWLSRGFKDPTKVPLWAIFEPFTYQPQSIRIAFRGEFKGLEKRDPVMTMSEDYLYVPYATQNRKPMFFTCEDAPRSIVYTFNLENNFEIVRYSSRIAPFQPHKDYGPHFELLEGPAMAGVKALAREAQTISLTCETQRIAEVYVNPRYEERTVEFTYLGSTETVDFANSPEDAYYNYILQKFCAL